ncbi:phosphotransferase [Haematomicrobium sanguinis]|uniref:phosphotransferase n=1 Tax=Haematomicrobium sanguinis TaxID=479106 RepID=UPI00068C3F5C|nr:phosphotransferase [Haematomicrobium sanguinis]
MNRLPLELAALATAAVPGLSPNQVAPSADDVEDFDAAVLRDEQDRLWRVRSPKHPEASLRLETEFQVLSALSAQVRAALSFTVPSVAGTTRNFGLTTFVYSHFDGELVDLDDLAFEASSYGPGIGKAIASLHNANLELDQFASIPRYDADEYRGRKLNELDQIATSSKVPPLLLKRWENVLEDVGLWRFNPTVVHGDLHEENLYFSNREVRAVTGWSELKVADPAEDFAWLIAASDPTLRDEVLKAYRDVRHEKVDEHIEARAAFHAEFALARWLAKGVATKNEHTIIEAQDMMDSLVADIEEQQRLKDEAEQSRLAAIAERERADRADREAEPATAGASVSEDRAAAAPAETDSEPETSAIPTVPLTPPTQPKDTKNP